MVPTSTPHSVIVVGGGIAGIAASVRLAEAGVRVTLLETRKKLGGRATSFDDVRSGQTLDNCQHVVLGCCSNYLDLLERIGARQHIRWYREQYWLEVGGRMSTIRPGRLPAPAHFSVSMLQAPMFTNTDRLHLARATAMILRARRSEISRETFASFLARARQPERLIRRFWSPVVISACNLDVDAVAASVAVHVFQEGFFANASAADIGVSSVPLVRLYDQVEALLTKHGGRVLFGHGVQELTAARVTVSSGEVFEADAVVCAVPVERVNRVVSPSCRVGDSRFEHLDEFTHSPILGVHLTFDQPVLPDHPHCVLVDRPTQWLFRKNDSGTQVHAVISAAEAWLDLSEAEIGERVLADMRACLPVFQPRGRADQPRLLSARAVKEKLATFAPTPGMEQYRPSPTGASGVYLAGDYTSTGWPATMEGAARSGYAAAAAVLGLPSHATVVPSLRIAPLARLLGLHAAVEDAGAAGEKA